MKTKLKSFCAKFSNELDPFLALLDPAITNLSERSQKEELSRLVDTVIRLQDVQNRAITLQEKIANQHAYLLIFGPLKSGKSTLMNAISGTYVSEVSCLPTYPALVYVKDGAENRFQATTYQGAQREFADSTEMKAAIQEEYNCLAAAILDAERSGKEFNPEQDHPAAIRRVDVELPAENLGKSGTVLVDTPGLYSRMKFGYDQMTKDFRDTAACAIFVVKTDDLFFEKVFEEFEELLGYFSRIFLVSNIDSSKQDLQPDGTLGLSLEGSDPDKVIEAFQSLSISATLQQAIDDGRLNIYSIDLLKAASRRLSERSKMVKASPVADEYDLSAEVAADDGFDKFLGDLTSYLNSSDYLRDFMTDTLGMAEELIQEEIQQSAGDSSEQLRKTCEDLDEAIEADRERIRLLTELDGIDWAANFAHLRRESKQLLIELAQKLDGKGSSLEVAIDEWMQCDEDWHELFSRRINPLLESKVSNFIDYLLEQLRVMLDTATGGARFSFEQTESLNRAGLNIGKRVPQLLENFDNNTDVPKPRLEMGFDEVPIRLGLIDKLLFRNEAKVRQQFFGADGGQSNTPAKKNQRLQGAGTEYLKASTKSYVLDTLPGLQQDFANQVVNQYIDSYCAALKQEIAELKANADENIRAKQADQEFLKEAIDGLEDIRLAAQKLGESLAQIGAEFETDTGAGSKDMEAQQQNSQFEDEFEVELEELTGDNNDMLG
jgi:GTPase SAR1 family protein